MRLFPAMLAAAMACCLLPLSAAAAPETTEETSPVNTEYSYKVNAEGKVELYDFKLSGSFTGDLVIPSEIDGHPVGYIGNACFYNAAGITSVTIPESVSNMGDDVFLGCSGITSFSVVEDNAYYTVKDGILFADSEKFFVAYPPARAGDSYTIPDTVDEIAPSAFAYAQNLKEVVIPESVQYIDAWAFAYSKIEKAAIPGSVVQIDDYAYAYCESLSEVTLESGIDRITNASFAFDTALEQITLPNTLTYIGQYAFCSTGLSCITVPSSVEEISYCAFGYTLDAAEDGSILSETAQPDFIVYGEPGSMAQEYATASDTDNDYENHFTFTAVEDADIPYELGGGKLAETVAVTDPAATSETSVPESTAAAATEPSGDSGGVFGDIGAALRNNAALRTGLGIGGGVIVLLGIILAVVSFRKKKTPEDEDETEDETDEDTEDDADEDAEDEEDEDPSPEENTDEETDI